MQSSLQTTNNKQSHHAPSTPTLYTLMTLSLNAANNLLPLAFQARAVQAYLSFPCLTLPSFFGFGFSTEISENGVSASVFKSNTLTPVSVAAAIHYIFGLKATLFTELPVFNSLNSSLKSVKSQTLTTFSLPPVAMYVPNGAIANELMLS